MRKYRGYRRGQKRQTVFALLTPELKIIYHHTLSRLNPPIVFPKDYPQKAVSKK
ncbi:MAG: hypothetical protein RHS_5127 [Robinsoniella sp. RHS]|nr:MAG: hypothetical protein RHS_5127 [Robinsoniella sp. RHS]